MFERGGFPPLMVVPRQGEPDPDFPTVAFPNPEEPGAMDLAMAAARESAADLVIANDPDADRCAIGVPTGDGDYRMLRGDDVGALLGLHMIRRGARGTFACSIVSSSLLSKIAADAGLGFTETLTGFKWIAQVPDLAYGYEEALGYCVDPTAGARQGRGVRRAAGRRDGLAARRPRDARSPTTWTTWPASTACTRPTSCRSGSRTCAASAR